MINVYIIYIYILYILYGSHFVLHLARIAACTKNSSESRWDVAGCTTGSLAVPSVVCRVQLCLSTQKGDSNFRVPKGRKDEKLEKTGKIVNSNL